MVKTNVDLTDLYSLLTYGVAFQRLNSELNKKGSLLKLLHLVKVKKQANHENSSSLKV